MASRQDGITQLYDLPQGGGPERLPQPEKTKDKVLLDERGLLDLPFLALTVLLVLIGVIMVFSASYARAYYLTGNSTYYFARQAIFAVAGIAGMLFVSRLNYQLWRSASFIILLVSVFFLMLVPIIGSTANGAKRWIEVAGIRFQPSELAKIAIIMTFSALISTYRDKMRTFRYGILPFGVIMVVLCGLVALERHFSCILIMLLLAAAMLFLGGVQLKWFALGGIAVGICMFFVRPVRTLLSPLLTVIRSTPVASFIILTLVMMKNAHIPTFITFLMVFPMLAGCTCNALGETDPTLLEAAEIYHVRGFARFCALYLPSIEPTLRSQALTALGFAWKAGVAAEVLCYPRDSIGLHLHDAKAHLETTDLFAYTLLVILVSLALEKCLRLLLSRGGAK